MIRVFIRDQMVMPVLERVVVGKSRGDAAAVLCGDLLIAPADSYFQSVSLAVGDPVRLLDESGRECFLGAVRQIDRREDVVSFSAYDRGVCLSRNELYGLFQGSGNQIAAQVAGKLGIPLGRVEAEPQFKTIVSRAGQSAFSILRRAVGEDREISIQDGALTVSAAGGTAPVRLAPERIISVSCRASIGQIINACVVLGRNGRVLSQVRDDASISAYGLFQRVRLQSGEAPAELLRGRTLSARIGLLGDLAFQCGGTAEAGDADLFRAWGLTGRYAVTAVEHRWEKGLFTTSLSLEA